MKVNSELDVICIGAGITSLAFGAMLLQNKPHLRILILDKHDIPGGYATIFKREDANAQFDCSLHKLSGMNANGGNLYQIFKNMGLEKELNIISDQYYFHASFPNSDIMLPNNVNGFIQTLKEYFPSQSGGIDKLFEDVYTHGKNSYYQFQILQGIYDVDFDQLRFARRNLHKKCVSDALDAIIDDQQLKSILLVPGGYIGGLPEDLSYLYYLHIIYATIVQGNAFLFGASSQDLSNILANRINKAGSHVLLATRAKRIIVNEIKEAIGVETKRGNFYAKNIFINAAPHYAMEKLFDQNEEIEAHKKKLDKLRPSQATTTLYLKTDVAPSELGLSAAETLIFSGNYNVEIAARKRLATEPYSESDMEAIFWRGTAIQVTNYHEINPNGGCVVILNVLDSIAHWPEYKSVEYKHKKLRAQQSLLNTLCERFPKFKGHVVHAEVSTPRTYERYTNNTDGAGYGTLVDTENNTHNFQSKFPVKNIQFLSAWVAGPSYEAAFGYAAMKVITSKVG